MSIVERVDRFDERADAALEKVRGRNRVVDRVFLTASEVGDFSMIWQVVNIVRGLVTHHYAQMLLFAALLGAESLVVNQGIKRLFRRVRPTETGDPRYQVRKPRTSSFPSGHASSAFYAASILTAWSGWPSALAWFTLAIVVGASRA
ncbi:MAG TPA: phosphatase PAP2 family protein, partial [Ilumatobacteraceae bacterium]|nr:phosphatase PAP2 family protein [Ilumatobacteraceae bacterium]